MVAHMETAACLILFVESGEKHKGSISWNSATLSLCMTKAGVMHCLNSDGSRTEKKGKGGKIGFCPFRFFFGPFGPFSP